VDPLRILRERWVLIALAFVIGGGAGVVASKLRPQHWESEETLILGTVPSDPTQPSGRLMTLRPQEEVLAFVQAPSTRMELGGEEFLKYDVDATALGGVGIHLHASGSDRAMTARVMQAILSKVEADQKVLFDDWQKSAAVIQNRLESYAAAKPAGAATAADDTPFAAMNAARVAALVEASRGPAYARPTQHIGATAPVAYPSPSHRSRDAAAGAFAAAVVAWLLAYAFALKRT
jgi:hypothetical protein